MDSSRSSSPPYQEMSKTNNMTIWHWLVVTGTSMGTVVSGLIPHSFGTLIASFKFSKNVTHASQSFNATQFQLNWLPALSSAFPCMFLPFFALLVHRLNRSYQILSAIGFVLLAISCGLSSLVNWWIVLFFTYSLLYSLGSSLYLAVTIIILAEYFPVNHKFHVLATSLFQIGYPAASLIGNPILANLIVNFGWKTSLKYISLVEVLCGIAISCTMKPLRDKGFCKYDEEITEATSYENLLQSTKRSFSTTSLKYFVSSYEMWPWLIGKYINYMCWYGFRTNVVTYLIKSTTFGLEKSASLMSIYAGAEIVVAFLASLSGDRFRTKLIHIHIISAIALAILMGIFNVVMTSYLSAILLMILVGIAIQFSLSFGYPASVQVMQSKFDMKTGWIFTNVAAGLGILSSPFTSAIVMDIFGIKSLFYAQTIGWILQVILFSVTLIIIKSNELKMDYQEIKLKE